MKIIKRNGEQVTFDRVKIYDALLKANASVGDQDKVDEMTADFISRKIEKYLVENNMRPNVEYVQDLVQRNLMEQGKFVLAQEYIKYRHNRELMRKGNTTDEKVMSLISMKNQEILEENSNKNPIILSTQRDYMAGEMSKDLMRRFKLPEDIRTAHDEGIIHFHDMDYTAMRMHNCDLVNLEDMLQNGTRISGVNIDKPHSFSTACNIASQIVAQVASSQFGGQTLTLTHLAPFVDISRQKIKKNLKEELDGLEYTQEQFDKIVDLRVKKEIKQGMQTFQYQLLTLMTTNGQSPFVSVFMYLGETKDERLKADLALIIEEMLRQRIQGVKIGGVWSAPAFPKLLYVLEPDNIVEGSKYWYLTKLAAECTSKRMVPDYISEKIMLENKIDKNGNGNVYGPMGCRSFLTPYVDENGKPKYYGRFNQGVVTINLIDAACTANGNLDEFWKVLDDRLELCHRALQIRHNTLVGTPSDVAPILWQDGALARLKTGETIDKLLYGGYSTISLGYAGLWETVYRLIGQEMTTDAGRDLGLKIMEKLNEATAKWKKAENMDYSLYGTPIESTTYKFAKCLQRRFGVIPHVTNRKYITNSYHVNVEKNINAFDKLAFESQFQKLSPGGAISYVEVPDLKDNIPAVLSVIKFIYDNIMYAELNTKLDHCLKCGYDKEISIVQIDGKWGYKCPCCGNTDKRYMDITRRTCGYLGKNDFNEGRLEEIASRVVHLGNGTNYKN